MNITPSVRIAFPQKIRKNSNDIEISYTRNWTHKLVDNNRCIKRLNYTKERESIWTYYSIFE